MHVVCIKWKRSLLMYQVLSVHTAASVHCSELLKTKSLECLLSHFPLTMSLLFLNLCFYLLLLHFVFMHCLHGFFCFCGCFFFSWTFIAIWLSFVCIFLLVFVSLIWICFHLYFCSCTKFPVNEKLTVSQ